MWEALLLHYKNHLRSTNDECSKRENSQVEMQDYSVRGQLEKNVSLARFTSWKVGGLADVLFQPADLEDLQDFLSF